MWPSGKAPGFGPGIRGFESLHPSQSRNHPFMGGFYFVWKHSTSVLCVGFEQAQSLSRLMCGTLRRAHERIAEQFDLGVELLHHSQKERATHTSGFFFMEGSEAFAFDAKERASAL